MFPEYFHLKCLGYRRGAEKKRRVKTRLIAAKQAIGEADKHLSARPLVWILQDNCFKIVSRASGADYGGCAYR